MVLDKTKTKNYLLCMAIFVIGMLSVSVANVFGGYYCSVAAIESILFTVFVYNMFDKKIHTKDSLNYLIMAAVITAFELIFFIINDVFDVAVYVKNNLNFLGVCVIVSQLLSICAIVYCSIKFVLELNEFHVEVVEESENDLNEVPFETKQYREEKNDQTVEVEKKKVEIKSIKENNVEVKTPFMEEER